MDTRRAVMPVLPVLLCAACLLHPVLGFSVSAPSLARPSLAPVPSPLHHCLSLASGHLVAWRQLHGVCLSLFMRTASHVTPPQPITGQHRAGFLDDNGGGGGVVMATADMTYRGLRRGAVGLDAPASVYLAGSSKRSRSEGGGQDQGERRRRKRTEVELYQGRQLDDDAGERGDDQSWDEEDKGGDSWLPNLPVHLLRARRQHSLSINSALVSLADMLMTNDYNRERDRQRAFRQQLLGLGR